MLIPTLDKTDGAYVLDDLGAVIDGDGSPRCYGPHDTGLDFTRNGGPPDDPYGYELNPRTGNPFIQGLDAPAFSDATRGFYVSSTTYQDRRYLTNDPRRYLDSEHVVFAVVTRFFRLHTPGVVLGSKVVMKYRGQIVTGIVGDVGPNFGEMSIAAAQALGIPPSPRNGGVENGVQYRFYPGVAVPGFELQPA